MIVAIRRTALFALAFCLLAVPALAQDRPALPPDAEGAMDRLMDSPRHGEWVDVPLGDDEPPLRCWVVYPEQAEDAPVVLVIHEIFGLTDWVRGVADQVAAEGYIAVAPDLLSGRGPDGGGTESFEGDDVRRAIRELPREEANRRLDAAREYAIDLPAASDRTGVMGFCWGGSATFNYAMHQPELSAAIVFYGTGPTEAEETSSIEAPVLGLYGGDDARVTSTVEDTAAAMEEADKQYITQVYDGAGHGFMRQQNGRDGANQSAAEQAWSATRRFLNAHLKE